MISISKLLYWSLVIGCGWGIAISIVAVLVIVRYLRLEAVLEHWERLGESMGLNRLTGYWDLDKFQDFSVTLYRNAATVQKQRNPTQGPRG